ncbi:MAG: class I SAM-dependent methyltransferase [Acidobacteria bacterium]|nr:class I SAM-dependent methyltransferase [Acidobacteriota bacterium]
MSEFKDHFSSVAGSYAAFRPTYAPEMIAFLAGLAPGRRVAWDCACGSGQASILLADHFERVVATDASREQIANAAPHPGIQYRVAREDDSGLKDAGASLVTVAQALHWLDRPKLYGEVDRVLEPGGVFAAWCYVLLRISPEVDRVLDWFYAERVGRWWPPERRHTENGYRDLPFPFDEIPGGEWWIESRLDRTRLLGYIGTWSSVRNCRAAGDDPMPELEAALAPHWPDAAERREIRSPVTLRVSRKPGALGRGRLS